MRNRKNEGLARRADPTLKVFVNAVRECLDKGPLYDRRWPLDVERFYRPVAELPAGPTRVPATY